MKLKERVHVDLCRSVDTYADMLMQKIEENHCNVYLVNTGMGNKVRQSIAFYKKLCKTSNRSTVEDDSENVLQTLEMLINE